MEDIKDLETTETPEVEKETAVEEEQPKTFTLEEVEELKKGLFDQEAVDKIVSDRLARERAKQEEAIEEQKRLAQLTVEERLKEEKKIAESEAEKLRLEIKRRDLKEDTIARLHQEGLDIGFTEFVMTEEAESTNERIKALKELFNEAVQEEANQRFKRPSPRMGGSTLASDNPWRKETFNLTKQGQLLKNDPERARVLMREAGK